MPRKERRSSARRFSSDYAQRRQRQCSFARLTTFELATVAHAPDCSVAVFADKKTAVFGDGDSDGATPDFAVGRDETGHEIFVFAARFSRRMIEVNAHDFVTGALHSVP